MKLDDTQIPWQEWFKHEVQDPTLFKDDLLEPEHYKEEFTILVNALYSVTTGFHKHRQKSQKSGLMSAGRSRLRDTLDLISLQYSAGGNLEFLKELYAYVPKWAEEYAEDHTAYHQSPEANGRFVWHIALGTEDYWYIAIRYVCLGMLLDYSDQLYRIMPIIDYKEAEPEGQEKDGLLERLVAKFVPNRGEIPNTARRHLPYFKLFKIFDAPHNERSQMMLEYLEEWYHASRREPYINQHPTDLCSGVSYYGYWSWEAAAVTWLLDIDDTIYRDHQFYPKDLVDFARNQGKEKSAPAQQVRLKVQGGERCSKTGYWTTPADPSVRLFAKEGDVLPTYKEKDWGIVFWYFSGEE